MVYLKIIGGLMILKFIIKIFLILTIVKGGRM